MKQYIVIVLLLFSYVGFSQSVNIGSGGTDLITVTESGNSLLPTNGSIILGSAGNPFQEGYFSSSSIFIGSLKLANDGGSLEWNADTVITTSNLASFGATIGHLTWADTTQSGGIGLSTYSDLSDTAAVLRALIIPFDDTELRDSLGIHQDSLAAHTLILNTLQTRSLDDADADITNELITGLSVVSGNLRVTEAGADTDLDLDQLVSATGGNVLVQDATDGKLYVPTGGTPVIVSTDINNDITAGGDGGAYYDDADASSTNEIQTATWDNTNNDIALLNANTFQITGFADSTLVTDSLAVHTDSITNLHLRLLGIESTSDIQTGSWDNVNNDISLSNSNTFQVTGFADSTLVGDMKVKTDFITITTAINLDDLADTTTAHNNRLVTLEANDFADADQSTTNEIQAGSWNDVTNNLALSSSNTFMVTGFADSTALADLTTTNVAEGTNQYYTEARVIANSAVSLNTAKNSYLSVDSLKLAGIEAGATGDLTGAEIKIAYEGETNTNAFTDALNTTLGFITATQAINLDDVADSLSVYTDSISEHHLRLLEVEGNVAAATHDPVTINATNNAGGRATLSGQELNITDFVEVDGSTTNEIQNLTKVGNLLDISIDATPPIDLSEYRQTLNDVLTQGQSAGAKILNLTLATNGTDAANLTNVTNAVAASDALDLDRDSTNELQTLSLVGLNLLLDDSDGVTQNTIDFSDLQDVTTNVGSVISIVASPTGAAIVGSPTVNYTRTKDSAGGYVTECWGTFQVNVTSNAGSQFTVIVNTSYSASFTTTDQVKGSVYCYSSGGTPLRILPSADTGNDEINLVFDTTVTGVYDLGFNLSFKN